MNKMQKLTCAKVLKVIFYLLGFPLLMLFVAKDSMIFFNEGAFSETAKKEFSSLPTSLASCTFSSVEREERKAVRSSVS